MNLMVLLFSFGCASKTLIVEDNIVYEKSSWDELKDFEDEDFRNVKTAFNKSCQKLIEDPLWEPLCKELLIIPDEEKFLKEFFLKNFEPFFLVNNNSDNSGLITGYYQPLLHGSLEKKEPYLYPLYKVPEKSTIIDEMGNRRRLENGNERECHTRAEIESQEEPLKGNELVWVDSKIDAFFLQIQGSGLVKLDNGELFSVGYAGKNSHKYVAIGKVLVEKGEIPMEKISMQSIREWLDNNPTRQDEILNENPSYVFFRKLETIEPYGSFGVTLTPKRSIAVDSRYVPMGYPMYISTQNHEGENINRVVFSQDKGGAIKGRVRADIYFGFGEEAEYLAGHMKGRGKIWALLPKEKTLVQLSKIKEQEKIQ